MNFLKASAFALAFLSSCSAFAGTTRVQVDAVVDAKTTGTIKLRALTTGCVYYGVLEKAEIKGSTPIWSIRIVKRVCHNAQGDRPEEAIAATAVVGDLPLPAGSTLDMLE